MRVLVTGADGFVGRHLVRELTSAGHEPVSAVGNPASGGHPDHLDVRDPAQVEALVKRTSPQACIHLAGMAFVPLGWKDPSGCMDINLQGTIRLLEALRKYQPTARFLMISSAEVYGRAPSLAPLDENAPFHPENIYALSKAAADQMTLLYARRYGMHTMTARPQNHIGPGQSPDFVVMAFARQVAAIASGQQPARLMVGNLDAKRDFTDVRDVVRGYRLLIELGQPGKAYNLSSEKPVPIRNILDGLLQLAGVRAEIQLDPERFRPTDHLPLLLSRRIREETGWTPQIELTSTLRDVYASVSNQEPPRVA